MAFSSKLKGVYVKVDGSKRIDHHVASKRHRQPPSSIESWRAPITILLPLALGFAIALAHHLLNSYLDQKPVHDVSLPQQWVLRVGTAFAFLVKLALTVCVGASFVQRQWYDLHRRSFKVRDVDSMTGVLGNALNLFDVSVWVRRPILAFAAIISWLVPLAAIITPGTLVVNAVANNNSTMLQVPKPSFKDTIYGQEPADEDSDITAQNVIHKLAFGTAVSGAPATIYPAFVNETYHLDFRGPAVKCTMANQSTVDALSIQFGMPMNLSDGGDYTQFISWVPGGEALLNFTNSNAPLNSAAFNTLGSAEDDVYRITVVTNTNPDYNNLLSVPTNNETRPLVQNASTVMYTYVNVTECALWNVSYGVDFNFTYPQQNISVSSMDWHNFSIAPYTDWGMAYLDANDSSSAVSYAAIMEAFGKLLVGMTEYSHYGVNTTTASSWPMININWENAEDIQLGLESLFQNLTLSLFSNPDLILDDSQTSPVPVNVTTWPITYVYKSLDLILAYGLGLFTSAICAVFGLHAFWVDRASYQNLFSTFVRTTNDADLRSLTSSSDLGADPLPDKLAKAVISMASVHRPVSVQPATLNTDSVPLVRLGSSVQDTASSITLRSSYNEGDATAHEWS